MIPYTQIQSWTLSTHSFTHSFTYSLFHWGVHWQFACFLYQRGTPVKIFFKMRILTSFFQRGVSNVLKILRFWDNRLFGFYSWKLKFFHISKFQNQKPQPSISFMITKSQSEKNAILRSWIARNLCQPEKIMEIEEPFLIPPKNCGPLSEK